MASTTTIIFSVLRILLVILFGGAALANVVGLPVLVDEFEQIGLGQWFRYVTAATQMAGAALLLRRMTAPIGDLLLLGVSIGALIAQHVALHGDVIHVFIMIALVATLGWFDIKRWSSDRAAKAA